MKKAYLIFILLLVCTINSYAASDITTKVNISSKVLINRSAPSFNSITGQTYLNISVKNNSNFDIALPIYVVIDEIKGPVIMLSPITFSNPDNKGRAGKHYVIISKSNSEFLKYGETTDSKQIIFNNKKNYRFTFNTKVYAPVDVMTLIGSSGGSLNLLDNPNGGTYGLYIDVPQNTFGADTTISVNLLDQSDSIVPMDPINQRSETPIADLKSSNPFCTPVTVCFPVENISADKTYHLNYLDELNRKWITVNDTYNPPIIDTLNNRVCVQLDHFSKHLITSDDNCSANPPIKFSNAYNVTCDQKWAASIYTKTIIPKINGSINSVYKQGDVAQLTNDIIQMGISTYGLMDIFDVDASKSMGFLMTTAIDNEYALMTELYGNEYAKIWVGAGTCLLKAAVTGDLTACDAWTASNIASTVCNFISAFKTEPDRIQRMSELQITKDFLMEYYKHGTDLASLNIDLGLPATASEADAIQKFAENQGYTNAWYGYIWQMFGSHPYLNINNVTDQINQSRNVVNSYFYDHTDISNVFVSDITSVGATINTAIDNKNKDATVWIEWGTDANALTQSTSAEKYVAFASTSNQTIFISILGLKPDTIYYYRVVSQNGFLELHKYKTEIMSFKTAIKLFSLTGIITSAGTPLSGVTVTLSGAAAGITTTAADGSYSFTNIPNGNYTITPSFAGYTFTPTNVTVNNENLVQNVTPATLSLNDGLVAYYPFDGNANDASGNANNGIVHGGLSYTNGVSGQAASFDGIDDYIEIANHQSLQLNRYVSISYFIAPSRQLGHINYPESKGVPIVMKGRHTGNNYASLISGDLDCISFQQYPFGWSDSWVGQHTFIVPITLSENEWVHIVEVRNDTQISIFVNGTLVGSGSANYEANITDEPLFIGYDGGYGYRTAKGRIDEVRIYNRALTEAEIQELYISGGYGSNTASYVISGQIMKDGAPLSNVTVTLTDSNGAIISTGVTDANGNYSFQNIPNGSYTITPSLTGYTFTPTNVVVNNGNVVQNVTTAASSINDDLVAYYPFDGNANDASGNGNNETVFGATTTADASGNQNKAMYFDGVDDRISLGAHSEINGDMSILFSAKPSNNDKRTAIILESKLHHHSDTPSTQNSGYGIYVTNLDENYGTYRVKFRQFISNSTLAYEDVTVANADIYDGNWHKFAFVKSGNIGTWFIDGVRSAVAPLSSTIHYLNSYYHPTSFMGVQKPICINCGDWNEGKEYFRWYNGALDEVRIYNRALSETEIQQLSSGLIAYYPFNGNANDESGNGNHVTSYGITYGAGSIGQSASFSGMDSYIQLSNIITPRNQFTVSAFINVSELKNVNQYIYSDYGVGLRIVPGGYLSLVRFTESGGAIIANSSVSIETGTWHHVSATYDGYYITLYIDGLLAGSPVISTMLLDGQDSVSEVVGKCYNNTVDYDFVGSIDELRIYNRALSESEIKTLAGND